MFVPFLIMLREGLEAALIVSLIASYLKRTQRGRWIGVMWIGVLLAAALCLGLGIFINETTGEFPQKEQELFEGIVAVIAVVILTWMVFWMRKVSRNVKVQLEQAVDSALQRGNHVRMYVHFPADSQMEVHFPLSSAKRPHRLVEARFFRPFFRHTPQHRRIRYRKPIRLHRRSTGIS